jgi:hypothetical protein
MSCFSDTRPPPPACGIVGAAAFGAERLFGDTLRSNQSMIALARKSGFAFARHPDDWKLVRFAKEIAVAPEEIPCASWRIAAQNAALTSAGPRDHRRTSL